MEKAQRQTVSIDYGTSKDFFAIRIVNDDMKNAHVQRGAIVIVHKQRYANDGEIVLALYNGKLLLRYYKESGDDIYLTAANNDILPFIVRNTDDFTILGKICEIRFEL